MNNNEEITKEYILNYLKNYYEKNKKIPRSKDKNHPFTCFKVSNRFGSWNEALKLAGIPILRNTPVKVNCFLCKKDFVKQICGIKKTKNNFCSHACSAKYNNSIRVRNEDTNNKIRLALQKTRECSICQTIIKGGSRKTCSRTCLKQIITINGKISGKKGGLASVAVQQRRSKNEILFSELCIKHFGQDDIQLNEQIFRDKNGNFWDSDIFIKTLKIAILWDGHYFHYSDFASKKQKARDILKRKIILDNGCKYYTIIDKGRFNPKFVKEQFDLFIHKLKFKDVLIELTTSYK